MMDLQNVVINDAFCDMKAPAPTKIDAQKGSRGNPRRCPSLYRIVTHGAKFCRAT